MVWKPVATRSGFVGAKEREPGFLLRRGLFPTLRGDPSGSAREETMEIQMLTAIEEAEAALALLDAPQEPWEQEAAEPPRPAPRIHADPAEVERRVQRVFLGDEADCAEAGVTIRRPCRGLEMEATEVRRARILYESRASMLPRCPSPLPRLALRSPATPRPWELWRSDFED